MKMAAILLTLAFFFVLFLFVWFFMPEAQAQDVHYVSMVPDNHLDISRLMSALAAVENTPPHVISHSGARSKYQIMESVWHQHSGFPFAMASSMDPVGTAEVAKVVRKHIKWIIEELQKRSYTATPTMVGQVWAAGLTKWVEHRQTFSEVEFGTRVGNVYSETSQ